MIIEITLILVLIYILNLSVYWILYLKAKDKKNKSVKHYYNIFPIIWISILIIMPIINSSLLKFYFSENLSYFKEYWTLFVLLGVVFLIIGINFAKKARQMYRIKNSKLVTTGVFKIIRHPSYSAVVIIFFGAALISDSLITLIICPIILLSLEVHTVIEEKLILIPRYGNNYEEFKEKTPYRLIPTPLNFILIIIAIIIIYVGFLNIS